MQAGFEMQVGHPQSDNDVMLMSMMLQGSPEEGGKSALHESLKCSRVFLELLRTYLREMTAGDPEGIECQAAVRSVRAFGKHTKFVLRMYHSGEGGKLDTGEPVSPTHYMHGDGYLCGLQHPWVGQHPCTLALSVFSSEASPPYIIITAFKNEARKTLWCLLHNILYVELTPKMCYSKPRFCNKKNNLLYVSTLLA